MAVGFFLAKAVPWYYALPLAFISHFFLDTLCLYHPPGVEPRPHWWSILYRIFLDEWQWKAEWSDDGSVASYTAPGMWHSRDNRSRIVLRLFAGSNLAWYSGYFKPDSPLKHLLFWTNIVVCWAFVAFTFWGYINWFGWLCAAIAWLGFDWAWAVRDLWPKMYNKLGRFNPHGLVDWCALKIWPSGKPILWRPGAWIEVGVSVAALTAALLI
jgi:hypothetical protein